MDVQLLRLVDIFPDAVEDYVGQELLGYVRFRGYEDLGGFVAGVGRPGLGAGDGEE